MISRRNARWILVVLIAPASISCFSALDSRASSLLRNSLLLVAGTWACSLPLGIVLAWVLVRTDLPGADRIVVVRPDALHPPVSPSGRMAGGIWAPGLVYGRVEKPAPSGRLAVCSGSMASRPCRGLCSSSAPVCGGWSRNWKSRPSWTPPPGEFSRSNPPRRLGAILVASLWVAILVAGEMTVTDLFAIRTYAEEIYTTLAAQSDEPPVGVAPGILLIAWLVFAGLTLAARLTPADRPLSLRAPWIFRLGVYRWPIAASVGLLLVLLIGVPLGNLAYQAGISSCSRTPAGPEPGRWGNARP